MNVLFMQQQPVFATALVLTMRSKGFDVIFSKEVTPFASLITEVNPGVVIADISNGSNLNVIDEAKKNHLPVLVISDNEQKEELQLAFAYGADDYISLPLSFSELALRVNKLTRNVKARA